MNWNRGMIKYYAKRELRHSFVPGVFVCLVGVLLGVESSRFTLILEYVDELRRDLLSLPYVTFDLRYLWDISSILIVTLVVIGLMFSAFITNPLEVGRSSFFIQAPNGERRFSNLFSAFRGDGYLAVVWSMFVTKLYLFLWTLLLVVPGIIKGYEYAMVPYILSESPELPGKEARKISRLMTSNEKFELFTLDLSFLGWGLLALLPLLILSTVAQMMSYMAGAGVAAGIGVLLSLGVLATFAGLLMVMTYRQAARAQLYYALREKYIYLTRNGRQDPLDPMLDIHPQEAVPDDPHYRADEYYVEEDAQGYLEEAPFHDEGEHSAVSSVEETPQPMPENSQDAPQETDKPLDENGDGAPFDGFQGPNPPESQVQNAVETSDGDPYQDMENDNR